MKYKLENKHLVRSNRKVTYTWQVTAGLLIFKEVKHGLHFTARSGVKGETVA